MMGFIYQRAVLCLYLIFILTESSISNAENTLKEDDPISIDESYILDTDALQELHKNIWNVARKSPDLYFSHKQNWQDLTKPLNHRKHTIGSYKSLQLAQSPNRQWLSQCDKDLLYAITSIKSKWGIQMIDAFGKPASGLLHGEIKWPGNYDECLAVTAPPGDLSIRGFTGRYCWISLMNNSTVMPTTVSVGACLPSSCHDDSFPLFKNLIDFLNKIPFIKTALKKFPKLTVTFVPEAESLSPASIGGIFMCSLFVFLVFLGTFVDALKRLNLINENCPDKNSAVVPKHSVEGPSKEGPAIEEPAIEESTKGEPSKEELHNTINVSHEQEQNDETKLVIVTPKRKSCIVKDFLLCFSALSNAEAILDTSSGKGQLQCLHGIRFISMAWVILGHTYVFGAGSFGNLVDILKVFTTWPFQVLASGTYSVDTFFLLSGCLLTYLFLSNKNHLKTGKEWVYFYVHRYVRLTPVYAMVMFVFGTWWNNLGLGPFWSRQNNIACAKTWWWNLLYINNFVDVTNMCMGWSWYLSNDMQFFVISPIFLLILRRNRIAGIITIGVLLVASWIATGVISRTDDVPILFNGMADDTGEDAMGRQQNVFNVIYIKPYCRIGPYLVGVLLGLVLVEVKGQKAFLHKGLVMGGWLASQALSLILIYGLYKSNLGPVTESAHNALSRSAWGISVSWVIFACLTGHGGPVDTLLSWKGWIPLSRLTYCAYLVHPMVMYWFYNTLKVTMYYTNSQIVINYLAFVVLSYGVAFLTSLVFEAPIMKIEKFLKRKS